MKEIIRVRFNECLPILDLRFTFYAQTMKIFFYSLILELNALQLIRFYRQSDQGFYVYVPRE